MKTYVKIFSDFDRTVTIYVGQDEQKAIAIRMEDIEGPHYPNFGGAKYIHQLWEDGKKTGESVVKIPNATFRPIHKKRALH